MIETTTILLVTIIVLLAIWSAIIAIILTRQHHYEVVFRTLWRTGNHHGLLDSMQDIEDYLHSLQRDAETDSERIEYLRISARIVRDEKK